MYAPRIHWYGKTEDFGKARKSFFFNKNPHCATEFRQRNAGAWSCRSSSLAAFAAIASQITQGAIVSPCDFDKEGRNRRANLSCSVVRDLVLRAFDLSNV